MDVDALVEKIVLEFSLRPDEDFLEIVGFTFGPGQAPAFGVSMDKLKKSRAWQQVDRQLQLRGLLWGGVRLEEGRLGQQKLIMGVKRSGG